MICNEVLVCVKTCIVEEINYNMGTCIDSLLQPLVSSTCRPCAGQLPTLMIAKERREVAGVHVRVHVESPGDLLHD